MKENIDNSLFDVYYYHLHVDLMCRLVGDSG